ncbi:MAG: hypothetical protein JSS09_05980, partial [Verrucomicrobia bacterium]|nr:hypothetical protein [Verrucomicrobiota bacterium]
MNPTRTFENSYYYRQLATAYKDYLPKGTTETGIENTLSAFSLGTGLGFGFGFVSLFFNKNIKTSTLSFLGHKFSFTRKVPQLLLKGGLSFIAAYTVKNKIDDLLQHESIQRKIRSANGDQERDFWRTYKFPSGEPIEIGIKNYKMYEDRNLNSIMFSSRSFDQTTTDLLYLQKKEKMLDRIKQTCKSGVLKEINKDTQPSKGLCLGFAMNWMQYLFQNGLESILNRDLDDFENQSTQINTILLHKINEIACSSMKPSLISQSLSSLLDIPQERIHYIPLNSSLIKSNKITEAT